MINQFEELTKKPKIYEPGTHQMWTDPYIHQFLLAAHLDPSIDVASRKPSNIDNTIQWMLSHTVKKELRILDLGCGPGLYAERLAKMGHHVTGIDFSEKSIEYATNSAKRNHLDISYVQGDYCKIEFESNYDIIDLIFCDFGVLSSDNQKFLLKKCFNALNQNGVLVIDAYNFNIIKEIQNEGQTIETELSGFWRNHPYTCINNSFHYPEANAFLDQHVVIDSEILIYRFYNHYFAIEAMIAMMKNEGYQEVKAASTVIDDQKVTFYKAKKKGSN